jgi:hypothetical protein
MTNRRELLRMATAFVAGGSLAFAGRKALSSYGGAADNILKDPFYLAKVQGFQAAPGSRDLIMLGDSHVDIGEWPALLGRTATARGVPGDTTVGLANRLDEVLARRPRTVVIQIGVNDLTHQAAPELVAKRRTGITKRLVDVGARVISLAIFHVGPAHAVDNRLIDRTNNLLTQSLPIGVEWLDANAALDAARSLQPDDLHLNGEGYRILAHVVATALNG